MAKKTGEKYQAIIDAAVRVIARQGYHNAQVSRIAKEAKVADGTIYLYFENKDDILISLFNEKMGAFIEEGRGRLAQAESIEQKLYILVHTHLSQLSRDQELAKVTQIELRQSNQEISEGIGAVMKQYFDLIEELIREGIEKGVFRSDLDVRLARKMIFGTLDEVTTSWVMKQCKYDLLSHVDPIHNLFQFGLKGK
ncbi:MULTISPECIES: TetR/AcrR family transcriptional regulator [Brevibacillus]|uniref:TetR/AcrR family transcriptional regulator n=1 Tax=Brevibacillus TaxID=55080 RepID=UPI000469B1B1|nr:TetR/AcrR family transcriptional regulator [Brevibacillus borstelensis]KKX55670.1 TetR family transcriptional regulator [Brevibacillus borstelensis cifa_chp40]MBE5397110.1 TetR/AcrR family transcriptional regulator [Brevibacillus borstelensis]MCC0566431.1 TetR family transcriptional regulator [Brevibacillus borstelensis]MCM3471601.1 TetR family transcriptional regulator [Brevibacillus borstelensis]MCM3560989.1 TetR family transcriptional regulator [Brevibacillus borstelensis]